MKVTTLSYVASKEISVERKAFNSLKLDYFIHCACSAWLQNYALYAKLFVSNIK